MGYEFCKMMYETDEDFKRYIDRTADSQYGGDIEIVLHHRLSYETALYYIESKALKDHDNN